MRARQFPVLVIILFPACRWSLPNRFLNRRFFLRLLGKFPGFVAFYLCRLGLYFVKLLRQQIAPSVGVLYGYDGIQISDI
jgi:hypothetical protein